MIRRLDIIPYPNVFVDEPKNSNEKLKDPNLYKELCDPKYINEFMLILLDISEEIKNKKYVIPQEVIQETTEYINDNNVLKNFIDECLVVTNNKDDRFKSTELYDYYLENQNDKNYLNQKNFSIMMKTNNIQMVRYKDGMYFIGVHK